MSIEGANSIVEPANRAESAVQEREMRRCSVAARVLGWAAAVCVAVSTIVKVAEAQVPPVFPAIDENGVDVATGRFLHSQTELVIGQPGAGALSYGMSWSYVNSGYITGTGATTTVVIGSRVETFTGSGGSYVSNQQTGSSLTFNSSTQIFTFTTRDGFTATFVRPPSYGSPVTMYLFGAPAYVAAQLMSTLSPNGEKTQYGYEGSPLICDPSPEFCAQIYQYVRLSEIYNNYGYRLAFEYPGPPESVVPPNRVTGINAAVENCTGSNCTQPWPSVSLTYDAQSLSMTNSLGSTTTYTYSSHGISEVQFADHPDHDINVGYDANGRVSSVDRGYGTWTYGYADASDERTTTVTAPDSTTRAYVSTISTGRIKSVRNELLQITSFLYDSAGRQTRITSPEGNYTEVTYDERGNVTQTRQVSKTPGTPVDIVVSAEYPASCSNQKTCNKPTSTTDARGYRTDYTYDPTHGGVLMITAPAPTGAAPVGSGARPETRFEYNQFQARYMFSSGAWTNGTAVWLPTRQSSCSTAAPACIGTATEIVATFVYPSVATPNNLLPTSTTTAAGNSSVSATTAMTYTNWGDVQTVDGPLAGAADTSRLYYDAGRRVIGAVGPDPDGGGPLLFRAVRTTYTPINQPQIVERGTVTSQSDTALASFAVLEKQDAGYDSFARPIISRRWNGGSIVALSQTNYDNRGRPQCTAMRMNSGLFGSPPSDACSLGTSGGLGPDRITRNTYDAAGRISLAQSAYGTALAQNTAAYTYTANGQVQTLTDARSYRTTYEYDAFDRLFKRRYPSPSNTNQSSTTDYEQFDYDAFGRPTSERRRSGESFALSFDNLGRVTFRDAPGSQPDVTYGYDLLSRMTSESQPGNALTTVHDALSRASRA